MAPALGQDQGAQLRRLRDELQAFARFANVSPNDPALIESQSYIGNEQFNMYNVVKHA